MTNRKILIVDDDSELREALVERLALHEEFESIAVDNGTKGVQTAKAGQIDLVIMDVGLPDVDGRGDWLSRLNGWPMPSPTDASSASLRTPTHGSGPMWIATPSS